MFYKHAPRMFNSDFRRIDAELKALRFFGLSGMESRPFVYRLVASPLQFLFDDETPNSQALETIRLGFDRHRGISLRILR